MSSIGQTLYRQARKVMPGGTQCWPENWKYPLEQPGRSPRQVVVEESEVVDLDGKTFLDMSYCGIGATVLGYADPDVNAAVKTAIDMGSMSTLNCAEDVELAELLIDAAGTRGPTWCASAAPAARRWRLRSGSRAPQPAAMVGRYLRLSRPGHDW